MNGKSHRKLAAQCHAKLGDTGWDKLLADRVEAARGRRLLRRTIWASTALALMTAAVTLGVLSYSEEQAGARMVAMMTEVAYPGVGGAFSE